jgi:hypothetical protein
LKALILLTPSGWRDQPVGSGLEELDLEAVLPASGWNCSPEKTVQLNRRVNHKFHVPRKSSYSPGSIISSQSSTSRIMKLSVAGYGLVYSLIFGAEDLASDLVQSAPGG